MNPVRILLVDDHPMIRHALNNYLGPDERYEVVDEAANGMEAVKKVEELTPDLVIMDISMPIMDGIEATRAISKEHPDVHVIALTMLNENQHIKQMMNAGASGYLLKNSSEEELKEAIDKVMAGETYYSKEVADTVMANLMKKKPSGTSVYGEVKLTSRELEVLELIIRQMSNREIADELFISLRTVDAHKRNLLEKTGSKNVAGLVIYALEKRLFPEL